MQMQHPDSKQSINVPPANIETMKARGYVEVKPAKEKK